MNERLSKRARERERERVPTEHELDLVHLLHQQASVSRGQSVCGCRRWVRVFLQRKVDALNAHSD